MRRRIFIGFLTIISIALLIQTVPLIQYLYGVEKDRIIKILQRDAFVIGAKAEESLEKDTNPNFSFVSDLVLAYRKSGGARVVVTDAQGLVIAISDEEQVKVGESYLSRPEIGQALQGDIAVGERFSQTLGYDLLYVAVPVYQSNEIVGSVRLTYPTSDINAAVQNRVWLFVAVALIALAATALLAIILSRELTREMKILQSDVEIFANGNLEHRSSIKTGDTETKILAQTFNQLAEKISRLVAEQRNFASNASHQLRTPLTALLLRLEQAEDLAMKDPEAAQTQMDLAIVETERMANIVQGLLAMTRTESQSLELEPLSLLDLVDARVKMWEPLFEELGMKLRVSEVPQLEVLAVPGSAEQIFDNYMDNAINASKPADVIEVEFKSAGDVVEILISDQGSGLSADDRAKAFERFWRGDSERVSTGLGLSIVSTLCFANGTTARLDSNERGGITAVFGLKVKKF